MITVYSKSNCQQCRAVKRYLDGEKQEYREVNLDSDPEALSYVKEVLGVSSVPVTVVEDEKGREVIIGFAPSKLKDILN